MGGRNRKGKMKKGRRPWKEKETVQKRRETKIQTLKEEERERGGVIY